MREQATSHDRRRVALENWLASILGEPPRLVAASSDASFRRYFRLQADDGTSLIAMDAPPARENTAQFIAVAKLMRTAGLHVPEVRAAAPEEGFALLSDLGAQTYLDVITEGHADGLIEDALTALVRWQAATRAGALPHYDAAILRRELALFREWYVERHLRRRFAAAQLKRWVRLCDALVRDARSQPQVFVHRDFILRNLMVSTPNPGILDFQDALVGPIAYDAASLFRDAFHSFDEARIAGWVRHYLALARAAGVPVPSEDADFTAMFDRIGVQRHLKVIGIFSRLAYRDGKPGYLAEIPRFLGYLHAVAPRYPDTAELLALLDVLEAGSECAR
jgi:aminoglycoside/choline kinase family phosphotransferase